MGSKFAGALLVAFGIAQLVPLDRDNPAVEEEVPATREIREILRRACYDCHSHETRWPWYAFVAPPSWLVAHDVHEAREHLNFSTWNRYGADERAEKLEEAWQEIEEGEMPLWFYLPLHPEAELSREDRDRLRAWARADGGANPP